MSTSSTTASWRASKNENVWMDLIKRSAMVSTFCLSSIATWYYLKTARNDLKEKQKMYLTASGVLYGLQVALKLFYIQKNRPVPLFEVLTFCFVTPVMYLIPAYFAKEEYGKYINLKYYVGALSFLFGLYIEVKSEFDRKIFKNDPSNKGKLYTKGWNQYIRNPNYFGELLVFSGWNLFSFNHYVLIGYTSFMAISFMGFHIPEKEEYLSKRYSKEWSSYAKNVKALIPFIY